MNQAYEALLTAQKKIEVSQVSIEQGRENYKIVKNKYDNSLLTVTDLLDANAADAAKRNQSGTCQSRCYRGL